MNHLGGTRSRNLCTLALEFWKWCVHRKITLHAVHIPGRRNEIADWESQRLATGSGNLRKGPPCLRAILSGPLRELHEHTGRGVLQLEARPISRSRGRTLSDVVEPPPIPISTLCTDRQMPTQGQEGQSHSDSFDCTFLVRQHGEDGFIGVTDGRLILAQHLQET